MDELSGLRHRLKAAAQNGRHSEVLEVSQQLWAGGAREPNICLSAYSSALGLDQQKTAEEWVERGLTLENDSLRWRFLGLKGELQGRRGDWNTALYYFEQACEAAPAEAVPRFQVGKAHARLGEYEIAVTALRTAVASLDSPHPSWLMELGMAELKVGNLQEARNFLSKANQVRPLPKLDWMLADIDRRLASGRPFSPEATAAFYDDVFEGREEYAHSWRKSAYSDCWLRITEMMRQHGVTCVLDLGCGPGQFADCLNETFPQLSYHGIDFSPVAIRRAKAAVPDYEFSCLELPLRDQSLFASADCVVCTEVLEHVTEDVPILEAVPDGILVIFSVPNFDSFGHVRIFRTAEDVSQRYGHLFQEIDVEAFQMGGTRVLWLVRGIRRI